MDHELPRQITIQTLVDGVRYDLGDRGLGPARWLGLVPVGFGLIFISVALSIALGPMHDAGDRGIQVFHIIFALFSIPFLIGGAIPIGIGIFVMFGRTVVEITDDQLKATEMAGPIRWSRKRPIDQIDRLTIARNLNPGSVPTNEGIAGLKNRSALVASGAGMKKRLSFAMGYPDDVLIPLAHALADDVSASGPARLIDDDRPRIQVVEEAADLAADVERIPPQPADSTIEVARTADALTLTVPPAGIWKGSKGLMFFAIVWNLFISIFVIVFATAALSGKPMKSDDGTELSAWLAMLFLLPFIAVGVGTALAAINMGRRRAIIDIVPGAALLVTRQSIFKTRQNEWLLDQIDRVEVGPSGMEVNNRPVMELQVHPTDGKKIGLLSERDDDELRWLAAELRVALDLKRSADDLKREAAFSWTEEV